MRLYARQNIKRDELIVNITMRRLEDNKPEIFEKLLTEFNDVTSESRKAYEREKITATNGVDAAVCNGHTSASYCSNEAYKDYELIKTQNAQVLSIAKRK